MIKTVAEQLALLEETVKFYSEDVNRRAVKDTHRDIPKCMYNTEDGKRCAVGRCMTEQAIQKVGAEITSVYGLIQFANIEGTTEEKLDSLLEEKYRGYSVKLWARLQDLHDQGRNWDTGLSEEGKKQHLLMKEYINTGKLTQGYEN